MPIERAFSAATGTLPAFSVSRTRRLSTTLVGRTLDRATHRLIFVASLLLVCIISDCSGRIYRSIQHFDGVAPCRGEQSHGCRHCTSASRSRIHHVGERSVRSDTGHLLLLGAPILAFLSIDMDGEPPRCARSFQRTRRCCDLSVNACSASCGSNEEDFTICWPAPERLAAPYASAAVAGAGMSVFVVMGAWLSDDYGLSVAGLGAIATGIGAAELASSSAVSRR